MQVLRTKDYGIFKKLLGNRDLDKALVRSMVRSMKMKNLLHMRPIEVNINMEVLDGQHRLEAAKELEMEVCYRVVENMEAHDVVILNATTKRWDMVDYMNYFHKNGYDEYSSLLHFAKATGMAPLLAVQLLSGRSLKGGYDTKFFKKGEFKMPPQKEMEIVKEVIEKVKTVVALINISKPGGARITGTGKFFASLAFFLKNESVDLEVFIKKIKLKLDWIEPRSSYESFMELFTMIYNYKTRQHTIRDSSGLQDEYLGARSSSMGQQEMQF